MHGLVKFCIVKILLEFMKKYVIIKVYGGEIMDFKVDLHTHTIYSDGQYSPMELVHAAVKAGVDILSITDHDTLDGLDEAITAGETYGIKVLTGIELSARDTDDMHILGYCFNRKNADFIYACEEFKKSRNKKMWWILEYLQEYGVLLTEHEVRQFVDKGTVTKLHFAMAMVSKGYVKNKTEAFDRYFNIPDFERIKRPKPTPQKVIELIRNAGGIAVLAHPVTLKIPIIELDSLVRELTVYGLGGLECYYSYNTPRMTMLCEDLCRKYNLIPTGGSDFHGEKIKRGILLGRGKDFNLDIHDKNIECKLLSKCMPEKKRGSIYEILL